MKDLISQSGVSRETRRDSINKEWGETLTRISYRKNRAMLSLPLGKSTTAPRGNQEAECGGCKRAPPPSRSRRERLATVAEDPVPPTSAAGPVPGTPPVAPPHGS